MHRAQLPVLAVESALDRVGGDREYLAELIGCFLVDVEAGLREAREADSGLEVLQRLAASIEERAAEIGAEALAGAAHALAAGAGSLEVHRLETEMSRLAAAVSFIESRARLR